MPLPKGYEVFPAGYDELEAHVAGLCACVVFTGDPDADDLSAAAFERLFHEEAEKNPTVPPAAIAANILTYVERDMSIERVDFVGSPLRVTWFVLEYHAWVLIAARCGRVHLGDDAVSEIRGKVLAAMAELGVACSPEECDAEIERFVPRQSALTKNVAPTTRDISFAAGTFVQLVRYLHLAALRHRSYVTPRFAEAGVLVVADEHDGRVAGEITRYLISHRVDAYDGIARCRETDRILALLSETSVAAPGFWAKIAEGRRHGLRPIALTLCARTKLDDLEASVPDAFRDDFELAEGDRRRRVPARQHERLDLDPQSARADHEVVVAGRRHRLGDRNRPLLDVRCGVIPREVTGGEAKALSGHRPVPGTRGSVPPGPDGRRRHRGAAKPDSRQ
jgi:hypothetical protein